MVSHPPAPVAEVGNLPHPLSGFVGRIDALAELGSALAESRLVTVTGPGGFGKSRLVLEVARRAAPDFGGAVWLVDLVPVTEAGLVGRVLGQTIGVAEKPGRPMLESLVAEIGRRRVLLLVDNCEHLVAGCAAVLGPLLDRCPGAHVLATSRRTLGVDGERVYPLPPLSPSEGRSLFGLRAGAVPRDGDPAVDEICRRVDGMPLAIELAAALTRVFSPEEILVRLDDRFALLDTAGSATRATPATRSPHATLTAAIDWSYDLLDGPVQLALRRLAVFAGAFTAEAAGQVCGLARREMDSALAALVAASLLGADTHARPTRYRLLDTIRSYGLARLAEAGEAQDARRRHCAVFLALARRAEPELTGRDQLAWLDRLRAEQDELRAALDWSTGGGDPSSGLRLAAALQFFWHPRGSLVEGVAWLRAALAAAETDTDRRDRASALWGLGLLATFTGEIDTALPALRRSLALYRELDDTTGTARALSWLGQLSWFGGDLGGARRLLDEAVPLARAAPDTWCLADALGALAFVEIFRGAPDAAAEAIEECLAVAGDAEDAQGLRFGLGARATLAYRQGRVDAAEESARACLDVLDALGGRYFESAMHMVLAAVARCRGDRESAGERAARCLDLARESAMPMVLVYAWQQSAALAPPGEARALLDRALELATAESPVQVAEVLADLAGIAVEGGDRADARARAEEALAAAERIGDRWSERRAHRILGRVAVLDDDPARAMPAFHRALRLASELGDGFGLVEGWRDIAALAAGEGNLTRAVRLLAAADGHRERLGWAEQTSGQARAVALCESLAGALDQAVFASAWRDGAALSVEEAVRYASGTRGRRRRPRTGWASLTPAEEQVARLVARGLTNREIGARLFISPRTVQTHLVHAFGKLGVSRRAELAALAERETGRP
ncbi:MAG: hypothetical protein J2P19_05795 [Pseudonocardia sp.]|nr:hypothetical protein [Pseudonocardia sp.]